MEAKQRAKLVIKAWRARQGEPVEDWTKSLEEEITKAIEAAEDDKVKDLGQAWNE